MNLRTVKDRPRSEGLSRAQRMRRRADFLRCYRRGLRKHGSLAALHYHPNDQDQARLGITASRKVGGSVVRHRLKRRVREIFRRFEHREAIAALDVVVHLKPSARFSDFGALENELKRLLNHVIKVPEASSRKSRSGRRGRIEPQTPKPDA